jgi:hypothetical protein
MAPAVSRGSDSTAYVTFTPAMTLFGIGLDEAVGQVTERQHGVSDPVAGQFFEDALDHRHAHQRQHLLGRLVRQGT